MSFREEGVSMVTLFFPRDTNDTLGNKKIVKEARQCYKSKIVHVKLEGISNLEQVQ